MKAILNISPVQANLWKVRLEFVEDDDKYKASTYKRHSVKTNVLPVSFHIGDYVLICTHTKRNHNMQSVWRGSVRVVEDGSSSVFMVEYLIHSKPQTMHEKWTVLYLSKKTEKNASQELKYQAAHYDFTYSLVESQTGVHKDEGGMKLGPNKQDSKIVFIWPVSLSIISEMIRRASWSIYWILQEIGLTGESFSTRISEWLFIRPKLLGGIITSRSHVVSVSI